VRRGTRQWARRVARPPHEVSKTGQFQKQPFGMKGMVGHFQRGVRPVRLALRFGNERGLTSTASPAYRNSVL